MIPKLPGYIPSQNIDRTYFGITSQTKLDSFNPDKPKKTSLPVKFKELSELRQNFEEKENKWSTVSRNDFKDFYELGLGQTTSDSHELFVLSMTQAVLKFSACFFENLAYSNLEKIRVRKVIIQFFIEDSSIAVIEPKQKNSGITQGNILRRQRIKNPDGSFYGVADLAIGKTIELCGVKYLLYSCDRFTRDFYEKIGSPQEEDKEIENDDFAKKTMDSYSLRTHFGLNSYVSNGKVPSQKQFLENDRKVLRFYIFSGEDFVMNYFLADDTVEVREVKKVNSGKYPFPILLKRQKILKDHQVGLPGIQAESVTFSIEDIKPNEPLQLLKRSFIILSCDKFTQEFMRARGREFALKEEIEEVEPEKPAIVYPPHNGFGDEQDSLGSVLRLVPIPPKKNYLSAMQDGSELRFIARMVTDKVEDVDRRFVITFFLGEKSLTIFEKQTRNSGFAGGRFLERMKYRNPENGLLFEPVDLLVGKIVEINHYLFKIVNCDEKTKEWVRKEFGVQITPIEH